MHHLLNIGDRIYSFYKGTQEKRLIVERVTPIKAYAGGIRFKRITNDSGAVEAYNGDDYTYYRYLTHKEEESLKRIS